MSIIFLPPETISRVLQHVEPVCRHLRDIVTGNLYLQYVLELDKSGYIVPRLIRQDLEYGDMIQAVQNHRTRWQRVELGEPEAIEIPDAVHTLLHSACFSDDIRAFCFETATSDSTIKSFINFYQFPSPNKGTDYRYWVHDDLGFCASALVIQPEIDLMVLLEYYPLVEPNPGPHRHQRYRIHLRTMATNEPHPFAALSTPLLDLGKLPHLHLDEPNPMGVYGRILTLRFTPDSYHVRPFIIFFDWIAGTEVGRVRPESNTGCSIAFLSEEYFLIPQVFMHNKVPLTDHNNQTGSLLIFHLPPFTEELETRQPRHIATLVFPRLCEHQNKLMMHLHGGNPPIPDTPFWSMRVKRIPKIYELNRWDHLCLQYEAANGINAVRIAQSKWCFEKGLGTSGLLYISSQAILATLSQYVDGKWPNQPVQVPWDIWRDHAARLPVTELPITCMWGRKSAFLHWKSRVQFNDVNLAQLIIMDFVRNDRSAKELKEGGEQGDMRGPGQFIEAKETIRDMRYRRTIIDLDSEKHRNLYSYGLAINDEHFVTAIQPPGNLTGRQFFYVYTI